MTMAKAAAPDRRRWIGLAALSLGVAMIIVDATILNVAVPSIIRDLNVNLADAEWINSIYALVFASLLITVGKLGDLFGRKRLFLTGLVVFVVASLTAGLAPNGGFLILSRFFQGIGGAMILPSTLSTVNATFRGKERGIAFGIWGSVIGGTAAIGPILGGWLTTNLSWRWVFFINLPLGLIEGNNYGWWVPKKALTIGDWNWPLSNLSVTPVAFLLAIVGLVSFVLVEWLRAQRGQPVLVDLRLFALRSFRYGNIAAAIVSLGEFGLLFVLPLYIQAVLGYSAFDTGLVLLALALGAFLAGPLAATLSARFGARRVVTIGMALEASGILTIGLLISPGMTGWTVVPSLFCYGIGVGLATAQLTSVALAEVPPAESGQASGITSTVRQVGSALGIALLGTILATGLGTGTRDKLAQVPSLPPPAREGIAVAVESSAGQALVDIRKQPGSGPVVQAVDAAFSDAAKTAAWGAGGFVALGFGVSWLLPAAKREEDTASADSEQPEAAPVA